MRLMTVVVRGDSMLPALRPGDRLIVRLGASVRAGDVVVARLPGARSPGDGASGGASGGGPPGDGTTGLIVKRVFRRTPEGWWLESDNRRAPGRRDSWDFGAVPDQDITGRVVGRYWPLARLALSARLGRADRADRAG